MPTENRSSNTEMVSPAPAPKQRIYVEVRECEGCNHIGIDDEHKTLGACHECDWSGPEPVEDKCPGCERENVMAAACPDCGSRYVLAASKEFEVPAPQPHPDPIAWMVGTAFWWTIEEAERDAGETGLPIVPVAPMAVSAEVERLTKATAFVQRLVDCSGTQPSVATGYLRDILDELKGNTTPTAPVERDERAAFEDNHRICDLVRDEDCPEDYRNQSVQDSWEGWQARAEQEIRP
ncbi:UNVERIFIED_ORG: hypothetical protein J2W65_003456 [Pseudomonas parafulva]|nr:hypothetical protein [Pseudomonas parafulva]